MSLLCPLTMTFTMPQLVVTCSLSSICVVYNTDQLLQGMQMLDAAETRNTDAEIDKMVDFHNETLNRGYEIIGKISTAYCGTLVMGTLIQGLGGGSSVTFASVTKETGEDLLTDYIAGNIDSALGEGNPLRSILISSVLSAGINKAQKKIKGGNITHTPDIIDTGDVRKVVNDIDVTDIKNAVNDIDVTDVKTATNIKEPVAGPQQGHMRTEIKANTQTAIDVVDEDAVLGSGIETSYGKSSGNYKSTADFMTNVEYRNGKYYTNKTTIDEIGQIEARGEDRSRLNKKIISSRASTEGGTSIVYKYSNQLGTKYLIHEVTNADGYIIHRDFDAVRISSGQFDK